MRIRKATVDDMELLIKLRTDYLFADNKAKNSEEIESIGEKLYDYFGTYIPSGGCIVFIAEDDRDIYSTAFLSIVERPPRRADSSNLVGTVYNVFTYPQYRRKGVATGIMRALLEEAAELGIATVDLLATEDGEPLYEKLGFLIPDYTYMRTKLEARRK